MALDERFDQQSDHCVARNFETQKEAIWSLLTRQLAVTEILYYFFSTLTKGKPRNKLREWGAESSKEFTKEERERVGGRNKNE